jgi:hypothetical protein
MEEEDLKDIIAKSGILEEVYGGYEIRIIDAEHFPWYTVINFLLDSGYEVWMEKTEKELLLMSKPAVD